MKLLSVVRSRPLICLSHAAYSVSVNNVDNGRTMKTVICLFRNDLRLHDNESLQWACQNGDTVLPLYCFDPRHFGQTWHFGLPKTGAHRLKFLLESVADLRENLLKHGSTLVVRQGKPEIIVPDIISQLGKEHIAAVVYQREVTQEELDVEEALKSQSGIKIHAVWGHTMIHVDDLPFKPQSLPDVYTQFRKKVEEADRVRKEITIPDIKPLPGKIDAGVIPTFDDFKISMPPGASHSVFPFSGGETSALERLRSYFWETDNVAKYKETRNGMIGPDYSTKFSPWCNDQYFVSNIWQIDHDVCSNYGNWLYSAGIGNDPREDRKFNVIKQGLDYDPNGDFVRLWVPELSKVKGGSVHFVWTLSSAALSSAQVRLGESYPSPVLVAAEWRHQYGRPATGQSRSDSAGKRGRTAVVEPSHKQRGIDFYFHKSSHP